MITEEQRIARRGWVGGSDAAVILGLSKYKTSYQLYLEKKGQYIEPEIENQYQYWGNQLESLIRDEFSKRNSVFIQTPGITQTHPLFPFMRGHIDGWISEWNSVLEVKTCGFYSRNQWGASGSDIIPQEYIVQCAFYCSIMNCETAHIAVLIAGNDYRQYIYNRNLALESKIIEACCDFWDRLQLDWPPLPTNIDDLKLMFPNHIEEKKKKVDENMLNRVKFLHTIRQDISDNEDMEQNYKYEIIKFMEDAECLIDENDQVLCTYRTNKKGNRIFLLKGNGDE